MRDPIVTIPEIETPKQKPRWRLTRNKTPKPVQRKQQRPVQRPNDPIVTIPEIKAPRPTNPVANRTRIVKTPEVNRIQSFIRDNRGIVTIVGFVMFVILIIVFAKFMPIITDAMSVAKTNVTDSLTLSMIDMTPFFILMGIFISWFIYAGTK